MVKKIKRLVSSLILLLSACTSLPEKSIVKTDSDPVDSTVTVKKIVDKNKAQSLEITKFKAGEKLKLARILEGGACKNVQQGAVGVFKLYTSPKDVKRIIQQQGQHVFADFESLITQFSMDALQQAINVVDFQIKSNRKAEKERIKQELIELFVGFVADDIAKFERETTLMIDVIPELESLTIFLHDCEIPHNH